VVLQNDKLHISAFKASKKLAPFTSFIRKTSIKSQVEIIYLFCATATNLNL